MNHRIEQLEMREDRQSNPMKRHATYLLMAILALAFVLRVWGIGYGLPHQLKMDEIHEVIRALKLGAGEYSWSFGKGGLYFILFVEYALLYVFWWISGHVGDPHEFALEVLRDPSIFFLLGRLTVAIMGVLTCLVIFEIGRRVHDWRVGLGAALIGATSYLHATHSHIINVDIGMTLAVWTSILAYLEYERKGDRCWLICAGALGGIAIAFKLPGAIVLLPLLLAIGTRATSRVYSREMLKNAGILVLPMLATLTVVAPEWTTTVTSLQNNFSLALGEVDDPFASERGDVRDATRLLQTRAADEWTGYFKHLLRDYNLALSIWAALGAAFGLYYRWRWNVIWILVIGAFITTMSAADRPAIDYYLMPIMPALWLLSSQAVSSLSLFHWGLRIAGLASVVALPLVGLVRTDYEWTQLDTRILAKQWIEAKVPTGAKILLDGSRFRFVQSPPLVPDKFTIEQQLKRARGKRLSRGLSVRAWEAYAKVIEEAEGPKYELHSTEQGLALDDPSHYVTECFEYVVTSSMIIQKYDREINRQRFPKAASFYEDVDTDPRFRQVYSIEPIPWERSGPIIKVYKIEREPSTGCLRAAGSARELVSPKSGRLSALER